MLHGGHNFATDEGVGRYETGRKNLLLLHDVNIGILYSGRDSDKIKAIARSETVTAKVHSTTTIVSPLFIFCTSNMNLMTHTFRCRNGGMFTKKYESKAELTGQKRCREECLVAIKSRFLELFVRKAPTQDHNDLLHSDNFNRTHFILGAYERILQIMDKYEKKDFHSHHLIHYVASGLCKFSDLFSYVMGKEISQELRGVVERLCPPDFKLKESAPENNTRPDDVAVATPVPTLADRPNGNWFDPSGFDD